MQNVVFRNRCFLQVSLTGGRREEKSMYFGDEVLRWAHWGSRNANLARRQKKGLRRTR